MELTVKFTFRNETKGTFRYEEVHPEDKPPVIGAMYIKKYALEGQTRPENLTVVIKGE